MPTHCCQLSDTYNQNFPNADTSGLDPSSCFVRPVLILMASFIKCLRKAPKTLDRSILGLIVPITLLAANN